MGPDEKMAADEISFRMSSSRVGWEPETRAAKFDKAVKKAREVAPDSLTDEDVRELLKAGFRDAWEYSIEDGFTVWAQFRERGEPAFDFPIYSRHPVGTLFGMQPSFGDTGEELRDVVFEAVARLPLDNEDEEDGACWSSVPEHVWEELTDNEKEFVLALRGALIQMNLPPCAVLLMETAAEQTGIEKPTKSEQTTLEND